MRGKPERGQGRRTVLVAVAALGISPESDGHGRTRIGKLSIEVNRRSQRERPTSPQRIPVEPQDILDSSQASESKNLIIF